MVFDHSIYISEKHYKLNVAFNITLPLMKDRAKVGFIMTSEVIYATCNGCLTDAIIKSLVLCLNYGVKGLSEIVTFASIT